MPDPLGPISPQPRNASVNGSESDAESACVPPEPGKCAAPPNRSLAPPAQSTEPAPSRRAVDLLVSRAQKRPPADLASERTAARPLSSQAETGVTRSGDYYADVAMRRGRTSNGDTFEFMSATAQAGGHNELSVAAFRMQSQTRDGTITASSELLSAKAAVSARMLPGCDGPYVVVNAGIAQTEWTYNSPNGAEEMSLGVSPGPGFEGGVCVRDKDNDGLEETCVRLTVGPFVVTECSEADPPRESGEMGTGGGPSRYEDPRQSSLGAGGAFGALTSVPSRPTPWRISRPRVIFAMVRLTQNTTSDVRVARLTVGQVHAMVEAGILREGEPIELVDGVLIHKNRSAAGDDPMTIGEQHNLVVKLLARLDAELAARGHHMQTQGPVTLTMHDEPEPDGAVLRGEPRDYADRLPNAGDTTSVIEVADSSLDYDRTRKLTLYASVGIAQYVIVNLRDECVEVYEQPVAGEARYGRAVVLHAADTLALRLGEGEFLKVDVSRILP